MKYFLIVNLLLLTKIGSAQQPDSVAALKLFMKVCNDYKQLPVQVDMDIHNWSNVIVSDEDTSHWQARFMLRREGTYMSLGEMEQIANDSLLLLVNSRLKRMLLYPTRRSVADQMKMSIGIQLQDSSMKKLAIKYAVRLTRVAKDTGEIELTNRTLVRWASLPAEVIRVRYDPNNLQPYEVLFTKRGLLAVSESEYRTMVAQADSSMLLHRDKGYYVIRNRVSEYRYNRISHTAATPLQATVADRLSRDGDGNFRPARKFEDYFVSKEF